METEPGSPQAAEAPQDEGCLSPALAWGLGGTWLGGFLQQKGVGTAAKAKRGRGGTTSQYPGGGGRFESSLGLPGFMFMGKLGSHLLRDSVSPLMNMEIESDFRMG